MTWGKLRFVICVWLVFMCGTCLCGFVVQNDCLKVSSPENLKGAYACAVSDVGVPQHAGTLTGFVVYPKTEALQKACDSFGSDEFSFKTGIPAGGLPVILLVDGKDCFFTSKARNAQNAGAAGILVADDEFLTTMNLPEDVNAYDSEDLTIPSAMISSSLGVSIKEALNRGEFVRVNLEWTEKGLVHLQEQVDMKKKNSDECGSECDNQIEEGEWEIVHPGFYDLIKWNFMIKLAPLWEFLTNLQVFLVDIFMCF